MAEWLTSMLRAKGPSTKIPGKEEMTACRWPPSITILQLPQEETEGAQSALIKWQFTRCKYLRILGRAFHKALPWPMRPRRAPAEFERRHRIISVFFGFDPEFVEERSLHLFCFGWLPLMGAVAQCRLHPTVFATIFIGIFWPDSSFSCCRSLSPAALCLWRLACKHVWQVAFICLQACVAGCFHLQWHSFSVCFYGWSLSAPLSSSCLRFPALS